MDMKKMAEKVAAAPVPDMVAAGEKIYLLASRYEEMIAQFSDMEKSVKIARQELTGMLDSKERGVNLEVERILKKLTPPGFLRKESLEADAKILKKSAQLLKTAVR